MKNEIFSKFVNLSPRSKVIILCNLRCVFGALYHAFAKSVTTEMGVNFLDLCCIRSLINFSVACFNVRVFGKHILKDVPVKYRKLLGLRSIVGLFGFTFIVYSLTILPLFIVTVLFNTTPFWTGILAHYFLGENVTKREI